MADHCPKTDDIEDESAFCAARESHDGSGPARDPDNDQATCVAVVEKEAKQPVMKKVNRRSPIGLMICAVLLGCSTAQHQTTPPEGNWVCKAQWSCKQDGAEAQCSVEQQSLCVDNVVTVTGLLSIGTAQWSEEKTGSCYASSDTLYGTWSSGKTTAKNDEARRFERETLGGKSLGAGTQIKGQEYRVRITARTDSQFTAVNAEGRIISCTRP